MSERAEFVREAPPATEAPEIIELPPPAPLRRNGRAVSTKPGSQISRRRKVEDPRSERIDLRVTPRQRAGIKAAAADAGLSMAAFICERTLGGTAPRAQRRASEAMKALAQTRGEMSRRGGNLNQCAKNLNIIGRLAGEGTGDGRLHEMVAEMLELYRAAIAENRATCALIDRALGLRPADDH
jgi:hypothetical protein